ncbi:hypothetical protein D3C72_2134100 [compost metagenome]
MAIDKASSAQAEEPGRSTQGRASSDSALPNSVVMAMAVMRSPPILMALFQPALRAAESSTMRKTSLVIMGGMVFFLQTSVKLNSMTAEFRISDA